MRHEVAPLRAQVGRLWTSLADFYIRQGMYERARDVYEEGLTTVITVRDFSLIFDTLTQFEETLLTHRMQARWRPCAPARFSGEADPSVGDGAHHTSFLPLHCCMQALAAGEEAEPEEANPADDGSDFLLKDDENDIDLR